MYSAEYGSAPATAQTYSATPGKLWMTALSETTSLTFGVFCGLMEINLTKAGESVKSIAVTGTEGTYTLTCTDAQSIAEKKPFYIALPAGRYNKIVITDDADKVCTLTAASGITLEENHIKPVTFEGDKLEFLPVAAPLPGVFKVSSTKKVHFSKGNLYCSRPSSESTDWTWDFYDEQYEYIPPTNGRDRTPAADDTKIDLFTWGYNATKSIVPNGNDTNNVSRTSGNLTGTEDWGSQIGDGETWRTLTLEEWVYLLENSKYKLGVTICGKPNCMVLLPGDWDEDVISLTDFESTTEYSEETAVKWSAMEAAGAVCLPAAGRRENSNGIEFVGYFGHYWSSSAKDGLYAYSLYFSPSEIYSSEYSFAKYSYSRGKGISVRLVTDVK